MTKISVKEMIESGVHFGHRVSRWNPKMDRFIYGKRNLIHIINLKETVKGLARASHFVAKLASTGQQIIFVGTKRQIKEVIEAEAKQAGMPYVTERWLGGTLTNFQTIHARLKRLETLEDMETTGKMELYSKKIQASLTRELRRIRKNLEGIRELHRLPAALVIIDPRNERNAVKEANKLDIPVVALLDTDCDPDDVDIPIPANDDAIRSVQLILEHLAKAIVEGKANYDEKAAMEARAEDEEDQFQLASQLRRAQAQSQRGGRGNGQGGRGGRKPPRGGGGPHGPQRPGDKPRASEPRPSASASASKAAPPASGTATSKTEPKAASEVAAPAAAEATPPAAAEAPPAPAPAPAPASAPASAPAPAPADAPPPAAAATDDASEAEPKTEQGS